jgi:hypothetical protein
MVGVTVDRFAQFLRDHVRPALPLRVRSARWEDEQLVIGDDHTWHFSTTSSWRISHAGRLVVGGTSPDAADLVWELCGLSVVDAEPQTSRLSVDPTLIFDNGWSLEIFSDQHLDPWIWQLPDLYIVGDGGG